MSDRIAGHVQVPTGLMADRIDFSAYLAKGLRRERDRAKRLGAWEALRKKYQR